MIVNFDYQRASALRDRKPIEWLIPNLIVKGGVTTLFAQPGEGKTFLSLHFALKVATERGPALFVAGEGDGDLGPRVEAWCRVHRMNDAALEKPGAGFVFLPHEVNLFDDAVVEQWIASLGPQGPAAPVLIVLDALADNIMAGADEDRAKDVSKVFANVWRVVHATGAGVLIVHHAGWNTGREKGSINIRAKSDIVAGVRLEEGKGKRWLTIECQKNRKGKKFKPIQMELKEAITRDGPTLAVAGIVTPFDLPFASDGIDEAKLEKAMSVFRSQFAATGAIAATWAKAVRKDTGTDKGWTRWTCTRVFARLVEQGKVRGGGKRGELFYLTDQGASAEGACASHRDAQMHPPSHRAPENSCTVHAPCTQPLGTFDGAFVPKPEPGRLLQGELENALAAMRSEPDQDDGGRDDVVGGS